MNIADESRLALRLVPVRSSGCTIDMLGVCMNKIQRAVGFALLGIFVSQPALAAAERSCVSRSEMHVGIAYILPAVIEGVQQKCASTLPADAYLKNRAAALIDRYKSLSKADSPELVSLIQKLGLRSELPSSATKPVTELVSMMVVTKLQQENIGPDTCVTIDEVMALLEPFPAANMVSLIELIVTKVDQSDAEKAKKAKRPRKPILCPAVVAQ